MFENTICPCCDNLVGMKFAFSLTNDLRGKICAGCARPDHRNRSKEDREAQHEDPEWVAGRHDW